MSKGGEIGKELEGSEDKTVKERQLERLLETGYDYDFEGSLTLRQLREGKEDQDFSELRQGVKRLHRLLEEDIQPDLEGIAELTSKDYAFHVKSHGKMTSGPSLEIDYKTLEEARVQTENARENWGYTASIYESQLDLLTESIREAPVVVKDRHETHKDPMYQ